MWLVLGKTFLFIKSMSVKQECLNEIVYLDFQENTLVKSTITMNECLSAFTSTIVEEVHLKKMTLALFHWTNVGSNLLLFSGQISIKPSDINIVSSFIV